MATSKITKITIISRISPTQSQPTLARVYSRGLVSEPFASCPQLDSLLTNRLPLCSLFSLRLLIQHVLGRLLLMAAVMLTHHIIITRTAERSSRPVSVVMDSSSNYLVRRRLRAIRVTAFTTTRAMRTPSMPPAICLQVIPSGTTRRTMRARPSRRRPMAPTRRRRLQLPHRPSVAAMVLGRWTTFTTSTRMDTLRKNGFVAAL